MRDHTKEHQDQVESKYSYTFDDAMHEFMLRAFRPFLPRGRALELGCYKGHFTELLLGTYDDVTVVEAASDLVEAAHIRVGGRAKFITSIFETVELTGKYDAIFLMHTLEHLDDPVLVLSRINSWLSSAGFLFLVVPNGNAPSRQIAVKMGLISHNTAITDAEAKHGHRRTYAFDTLERDAVAAGLKPIHRGGVFFKGLANFQIDQAVGAGIISREYLEGCYQLGMQYPDLCASIYLVCASGSTER